MSNIIPQIFHLGWHVQFSAANCTFRPLSSHFVIEGYKKPRQEKKLLIISLPKGDRV